MVRMFVACAAALAYSISAAAQEPCVASAPQVVDDVYKQILERPADPGSAEVTQALAAGRMTVRDVVAAIAKSPEYEARFFWPPVVAAVYQQIMQRRPTPAEVEAAAAQLTSQSLSPSGLVEHVATRAANNQPDAIRILYRRLLGREPDPEGLSAHSAIAERDGVGAAAQSILVSPEYRRRATSTGLPLNELEAYGASVRALYRHVLGRESDPDGLRALTELAAVYGAKGPIDRMLSSPEYRQRYGENGIPGGRTVFCGARLDGRTAVPRR